MILANWFLPWIEKYLPHSTLAEFLETWFKNMQIIDCNSLIDFEFSCLSHAIFWINFLDMYMFHCIWVLPFLPCLELFAKYENWNWFSWVIPCRTAYACIFLLHHFFNSLFVVVCVLESMYSFKSFALTLGLVKVIWKPFTWVHYLHAFTLSFD